MTEGMDNQLDSEEIIMHVQRTMIICRGYLDDIGSTEELWMSVMTEEICMSALHKVEPGESTQDTLHFSSGPSSCFGSTGCGRS